MTPDLIALVLSQSLPVRLALLDADPTGAGWYINSVESSVFVHREQYGSARLLHYVKDFGDVWLPCNPRAIERHAQRLHRKRLMELPPTAFVVGDDGVPTSRPIREEEDRRYRYYRLLSATAAPDLDGTSERDYMNAIALLREVVNG